MNHLGHRVSLADLDAYRKDLGSLVNISSPKTLRATQLFLGSLNYYSRFVEDFMIYASVLYEPRETDFYEISQINDLPPQIATPEPDCDLVK